MVTRRNAAERIDAALVRLERADAAVVAPARDLTAALLDVHGEGLSRVVALLHEHLPDPAGVLGALVADPLVADLLALHGLHPDDAATRAARALAAAAAHLGAIAEDAVVDAVDHDRVRLRLGRAATVPEARQALHSAVADAVPELAVEVVDAPRDPRRLLPVLPAPSGRSAP